MFCTNCFRDHQADVATVTSGVTNLVNHHSQILQAGFKSDVHDVGVVQIIQRHDQLASHISLHR